jgi:hypothetical protein
MAQDKHEHKINHKLTLVRRYEPLPLEPGKTYKTKFSTGWMFRVERIDGLNAWGYYVGTTSDALLCPLRIERIVPEYSDKIITEYYKCPHCGKKIEI